MASRRHYDPSVKLSKTLAWILRHGAKDVGLTFKEGGFLFVDDLLMLPQLKNHTTDDVRKVVETNEKKRFYMTSDDETGKLMIRANQGHSAEVEGLALTPINLATDVSAVVHGTYDKAWTNIQIQGLSRMGRNHIHFAPGEPGESEVVSGMRRNCKIVIYINLEAALQDGIPFFLSSNNVILSPGNKDGIIPPKYFQEVWRLRPRERIL